MAEPQDDLIRPFQVEGTGVRGRLVRLGRPADDVIRRHAYPAAVSQMLGEALALAAALASTLRFDGVFSLQARGDGPVRLLVVDVAAPGGLRGYAQFRADEVEAASGAAAGPPSVPRLFGKGYLAFTADQGRGSPAYQGIVPLEGATLAECAHAYFRESEQIDTVIKAHAGTTAADGWRAGALLVQRTPLADPAMLARGAEDRREDYEEAWRRAVTMMASTSDAELVDRDLDPDVLLYRLYREDGVRVFEPQPLRFACRCSRQKAEDVLASLPQDALADLLTDDGRFEVSCEFCNDRHDFPAGQFLHDRRS